MAKTKKKKGGEYDLLKYLAGIMKEVGLTGFIVLVIVFVFLVWGTVEQKREFINKFILLKDDNHFYCVIVIVFLLLLLIIGTIYSEKMSKIRKEEINRIGKEKSNKQELDLKKDLHSSN